MVPLSLGAGVGETFGAGVGGGFGLGVGATGVAWAVGVGIGEIEGVGARGGVDGVESGVVAPGATGEVTAGAGAGGLDWTDGVSCCATAGAIQGAANRTPQATSAAPHQAFPWRVIRGFSCRLNRAHYAGKRARRQAATAARGAISFRAC
jgi:hypothetical protein